MNAEALAREKPRMPADSHEIAARGTHIYATKYREQYEREHPGMFVAIDVQTEEAFVDNTPEGALTRARKKNPQGAFHLLRIGAPGVFRVSYSSRSRRGNWISGR